MNLDTALEVANNLKQEGATVILTRSTDTFLELSERVDISKQSNANAFISMHYNYSTNSSVNGIETYYYTDPKDTQLANYVHQGLMDAVSLKDRGIRFGDLHVTRENPQPAILLELGFISNPAEEKVISSTSYYKQVASGLTNGLIKYFG